MVTPVSLLLNSQFESSCVNLIHINARSIVND